MDMSDTPETDHLEVQLGRAATHSHPILWEHSRKLERERNDLMSQDYRTEGRAMRYCQERDEARTELEMWRDGNIMHQIHRDELEKTESERNEALNKIKELNDILR
jgi:hypothetical protein